MRHKILLVGAGQLGSRYLQGLAKVSMPLHIWVSDVAPESLDRAEIRWREAEGDKSPHLVNYSVDLADVPSEIDMVIVATSADVRAQIIEELSKRFSVRYWVLEKILAQSAAEVAKIQTGIGDSSAWVNTPMYMWSLYKQIRDAYAGAPTIKASFEGFKGLACNAIHYIDFISRWNNSMPTFVNTSGLAAQWHPAKRNGFWEIFGELLIDFDDGSQLKLSSNADDPNYRVALKVNHDEWNVSESNGIASAQDGRTIHGACEFQSQLTGKLVDSIFQNGQCELPSLSQSSAQHLLLLNGLLAHWNKTMPNKLERLPIT